MQTALMILEIIRKRRLKAMYDHQRHGWVVLVVEGEDRVENRYQ